MGLFDGLLVTDALILSLSGSSSVSFMQFLEPSMLAGLMSSVHVFNTNSSCGGLAQFLV